MHPQPCYSPRKAPLCSSLLSLFLLSALFALSCDASAEILATDKHGFSVRYSIKLQAPPALLYRSLIKDIGQWWDSAHTFSGSSKNLYIEDRPQGCFCEKLNTKPTVQHMMVIYAAPGELLRMQGALGPLQSMAVTGSMSWRFVPQTQGASEVTLTYNVTGYTPEGLDKFAAAVNAVLEQQFTRFQQHVKQKIRLQSKG